jgi:pSer/pThr/pTyr-binding forkhead associated (FHA) protein
LRFFYQKDQWIIKDLNSKNGTFVNGDKISQESIIKNGDQISLAYTSQNEKGLNFTVTIEEEKQEIEKAWESLITADLACLLIDPFQSWSILEEAWINYTLKMPIINLLIIFDITKFNPSNVNQANQNISNIENIINQKFSKQQKTIKKIRLNLASFYPKANSNSIPQSVQHLINNFCKPLVLLTQVNLDQLIEQQLQKKIILLVKKIQDYNLSQLHFVQSSIKELEENLVNLQTHLKQNSRDIRNDREEFANSIRRCIANERTNVTSTFVPDSLLGKIDQYIHNLEVEVLGEKNQKQVYLQLQSCDQTNTHEAIIDFCKQEVQKWADGQWYNICYQYHKGGLQGLIESSQKRFMDCIPSLEFNHFQKPSQQLDWEKIKCFSFLELQQQNNSQADVNMGYGGDLSRAGVQAAMVTAGLIWINPISAMLQSAGLVLTLIQLIGKRLKQPQIQQLKLQQIVQSLKSSASIHYQNITRYLIEQVVQELTVELELQERQFRNGLELIDDDINKYMIQQQTNLQQLKQREQKLINLQKLTF